MGTRVNTSSKMVPLEQVADFHNGKAFNKKTWKSSGKPIIRIQNLNDDSRSFNYTDEEWEERYQINNGELLFSWAATLDAYIWNRGEAYLNQHIFKVVPKPGVDSKYLYYELKNLVSHFYRESHGSGMVHITKGKFLRSEISLPDLPTQRAIVERLDALHSELDAGVASLERAKAKLKVYRQSVLQRAFSGELTRAWRERQTDLPTSEELLAEIRAAREGWYAGEVAKYEEAYRAWVAGGEVGKKPRKVGKLKAVKPISEEERAELGELPAGWCWVRLGDTGMLDRGKSKHRPRNDPRLFGGTIPFIQTGEVKMYSVIRRADRHYSQFGLEQSRLWPVGTLCITIAANIGETARLGIEACFPDSVVGYFSTKGITSSTYIELYLVAMRSKLDENAPATAQKNINLEVLHNLYVPIPGVKEQELIVYKLEEIFQAAETATKFIENSNERALILKHAF